jgi:hypothetical protein
VFGDKDTHGEGSDHTQRMQGEGHGGKPDLYVHRLCCIHFFCIGSIRKANEKRKTNNETRIHLVHYTPMHLFPCFLFMTNANDKMEEKKKTKFFFFSKTTLASHTTRLLLFGLV